MIEHAAWVGSDYRAGINGQRVALVGYSHWRRAEEEDTAEATRECIRKVMSGKWNITFFTQIRNYFGYENHGSFWERVMFFNYLPDCVLSDHRFKDGTGEQISRAKDRFLRLLRHELPQTVIVFTSRQWAFPIPECDFLPLQNFPKFSSGTYGVDDHTVKVFFLRHPQGAKGELMRRAVKYVLDQQTDPPPNIPFC